MKDILYLLFSVCAWVFGVTGMILEGFSFSFAFIIILAVIAIVQQAKKIKDNNK